jgi:tRNA pseudouridine55 synthase
MTFIAPHNGWINIYKPKGISSAHVVAKVKRLLPKNIKVGHAGTLDLEAEGILPIAFGQATKLISILMDARKTYEFTIQFGAITDTKDAAGVILKTTKHIPTEEECNSIFNSFLGTITQIPPIYSALKISGTPAYKLAREGKLPEIKPREITIFDIKMIGYDLELKTASYITTVSKGTYIRTLAEDISFFLQSLGFVLELRRTQVGIFNLSNSVDIDELQITDFWPFSDKIMNMEKILVDIPVIHIDVDTALKARYGQKIFFEGKDYSQKTTLWLENDGHIVAIGYIDGIDFISLRVFNY